MSQTGLRFGATLEDVIDDLRKQVEPDEQPAYRAMPEVKAAKPRREMPAAMGSDIQAAVLGYLGPGRRPYVHQQETWDHLYAGRSVVITTPTASGKTMAFAPPILDAVVNHGASALYVFPLTDLAVSQKNALDKLLASHQPCRRKAAPAVVEWHSAARDPSARYTGDRRDSILTTPESLHGSILPGCVYANNRDFF